LCPRNLEKSTTRSGAHLKLQLEGNSAKKGAGGGGYVSDPQAGGVPMRRENDSAPKGNRKRERVITEERY
jgi:hypothetical protein